MNINRMIIGQKISNKNYRCLLCYLINFEIKGKWKSKIQRKKIKEAEGLYKNAFSDLQTI